MRLSAVAAVVLAALWGGLDALVFAQGSLTPPGPPGATMRSLDQIEPRTLITNVPFTVTQSGSYVLAGNLASASHGIVIQADNVTVDLAGFTLSGDYNSGGDYGIWVDGSAGQRLRGVVVRNGSVTRFGRGVVCEYGAGCQFDGLAVSSNLSFGVQLHGASGECNNNRISRCIIRDNADHGVYLYGLSGQCNGNTVRQSASHANAGYGFYLDGSSGQCNDNTIINCTVSDNEDFGMLLYGTGGQCSGNTIEQCTVSSNGNYGIYLYAPSSGRSDGNVVDRCSIRDNADIGVHLSGSGGQCDGNTITRCAVRGNGGYGVRLYGTSGQCRGNVVRDCTVSDNVDAGITCEAADGNRVEGNHVSHQTGIGSVGIAGVSSARNLIVRNSCVGHTNNFLVASPDTYGPIVTNTGALGSTGDASHPWANFSW